MNASLVKVEADLEPAPHDADAEVVKRAVNGDRDAFASLVRENYDFIYRVAYKWLGAVSDAEDVAQEVCVKLARIIEGYEARASFRSWLYRVVINAARDHVRKVQRRSEASPEALSELPSQDESAEEALSRQDLWTSVRQLPPRQADAVLLVYAEEKSHAETAQILGCSENTVSWHIHEAKKALRSLLDQ